MSHTITMDRSRVDVGAVHALLRSTYWSEGVRRDVVEKAIAGSLVVVAIDDTTGATIGVARTITGHATFAYLCDVCVHEAHRKLGIALGMIAMLEAVPTLATIRRWCLVTRDAQGLYRGLGYVEVTPGRWMEKVFPRHRWQERLEPPSFG